MRTYQYHPFIYFAVTYIWTWVMWFIAAAQGPNTLSVGPGGALMAAGLLVPGIVGFVMVLVSHDKGLKARYRRTVLRLSIPSCKSLIAACALYLVSVAASILLSCAFGQSLEQFSWEEGYSFADGGVIALLVLVLASILEEWGWRGYGEDSVANRHTWFAAALIFGAVWSLWHLPLFFISGTYQNTLTDLGILYVLSFFISGIPLTFILTWVYVKTDRSMLAVIILHFFVNFCQERIAMTPETKCVETLVVIVLAIIVVVANRDLFFSRAHIGHLAEAEC